MSDLIANTEPDDEELIAQVLRGNKLEKYTRMVFAALGAVPAVGGLFAAAAAIQAEHSQGNVNETIATWIASHEAKVNSLNKAITEILTKLEAMDGEIADEVDRRMRDDSYISLVARGFRTWDRADTEDKRAMIVRCLIRAAASRICSDDVVRLFVDWVDRYDELHFRTMRVVYKNRGATRAFMWDELYGESVRDDSAEADLFKLLVDDLSLGRVMRQIRQTNAEGQFLSQRGRSRRRESGVLQSPFENTKPYELTSLGSQFLHYTLEDVAPEIGV